VQWRAAAPSSRLRVQVQVERETDGAEFIAKIEVAADHLFTPRAFLDFQQVAQLGEMLVRTRDRQPSF
jgi:hypothetical protein